MSLHKLQQDAFKIFQSGVQAVAPHKLISDALKVSCDKLLIQDTEYHLNHNVHLVAFGKAVFGMVQAVERILGSHIVQGVVSVPNGTHMVQTCEVITLILSDVLGDPMDIIACGPTVPDMSTKRDCLEIIEKLKVGHDLPVSVIKYLNSKENAKESLNFSHVNNIIIGNNIVAVDGASLMAHELGYDIIIYNTSVNGEARDVGKLYAKLGISPTETTEQSVEIKDLVYKSKKSVCILGAGETTVSVRGNGRGGRSQELALAAAIEMNKSLSEGNRFLLSAGTDGQDGPTSAAGAYAFPKLITMAAAQGLDAMAYLENNDSFSFYSQFENGKYLVNTGLTGTNVMDLQVLLLS